MRELDSILQAWRTLQGANCDAVLATVVHVTGSAYRRPGARMLLVPDGRRIGSISGGCLEGEIAKKAWWYTEDLKPELRVYDTSSDDDAVWEFGLGCNGIVHVLLERVQAPEATRMLTFLDRQAAIGEPSVVATVIRAEPDSPVMPGERLLVPANGSPIGGFLDPALARQLAPHIQEAIALRRSALVSLGACEVFVEYIGRPLQLVIFGAGHDAIPLVEAAANMGWDVTVADGRPSYAKPERFPRATRVVALTNPGLLDRIPITPETFVVMMTHNYPMDRRLMPLLIERAPAYIGLLGPRSRATRLFDELDLAIPSYVHAPAGLDVGGDSPQAIALSIAAEIQAVVSRRAGGPLRLRAESIHEPALTITAGVRFNVPLSTERPTYCEVEVESLV